MDIRSQLRTVVLFFVFYLFSGLVAAYFLWHAVNGQRGLKARNEYAEQITQLQTSLDNLKAENLRWKRRIALVNGETVDRDLLEEEAHDMLGKLHHDEVQILTNLTLPRSPETN